MTCGDPGMKTRMRSCDNPAPQHSGDECPGNASEEDNCPALVQCPIDGNWSDWTEWGYCDATCGNDGMMIRSRACDSPAPQFAGTNCDGDLQQENSCTDIIECPGTNEYNLLQYIFLL